MYKLETREKGIFGRGNSIRKHIGMVVCIIDQVSSEKSSMFEK